jgi:hypothetical protein
MVLTIKIGSNFEIDPKKIKVGISDLSGYEIFSDELEKSISQSIRSAFEQVCVKGT